MPAIRFDIAVEIHWQSIYALHNSSFPPFFSYHRFNRFTASTRGSSTNLTDSSCAWAFNYTGFSKITAAKAAIAFHKLAGKSL